MQRLRSRAKELCQEGVFRAASGTLVLSSWGRLFATAEEQTTEDQELFKQTETVSRVDVFVSHSWAANRWAKVLALCFFLNWSLAIKATVASVLLSVFFLRVLPEPSIRVMFIALMDFPVIVFLLVFFFGHRLTLGLWCPSLWVDQLCVHQTDSSHKSRGISGLPTFVSCSSQLLVLWDETYFRRLWCNYELSIFVKCQGLNGLRFVPLWLPQWLLTEMLLAYVGARLLAIALDFDPEFGVNDTDTYNKYTPGSADALLWGIQRCMAYVVDAQSYVIFFIPSAVVSVISFHRKLEGHRLLLQNMQSFDIRNAECSLQSDRSVIETQVAELFDGLEEPLIAVPVDEGYGSDGREEETAALAGYEDLSLTLAERDAVRSVTGYPDRDSCLDAFNEYVHRQVREAIVEDFGSETDLSWVACVLTFLPNTLSYTAMAWAARHHFAQLGFSSVGQYFGITYVQYLTLGMMFLPVAHPILLRLMSSLPTSSAVLRGLSAFVCGLLIYSILIFWDTLAAGTMESFALTMHPAFLTAYLFCMCLLVLQFAKLFGRPRWKPNLISRCCGARRSYEATSLGP